MRTRHKLHPHTLSRTNMVTESFSGSLATITHKGDHISGLFPDCHVVPASTYNLLAIGPYLDHTRNAIILTPTSAIQLTNLNFDHLHNSRDPRLELIRQLQRTNSRGLPLVDISTVGSREGPGALYHTNLFDTPPPGTATTRSSLINSVRNRIRFNSSKITTSAPAPVKTTTPTTKLLTISAAGSAAPPDPTWTTSTATEKALLELRQLHCAMGHPAESALLQALRTSPKKRHKQLIKYVKLMDKCNSCPAGTQKALPHSNPSTSRATTYLARLFLDCSGRQPVKSIGGHWYFLIIIDDYSRMKWIRFLKSISEVAAIFDNFLRTVVRQGMPGAAGNVRAVQIVRTDSGPDFNCNKFRQVLQSYSITHEPSPPDASQQRGVAERGIGVTSEIARSNLFWACAPLPFWGPSTNHATTTSNNLPNRSNPGNKSPFEMVNPCKPSQIALLRPFGCLTFTLVKTIDRKGKLNQASSIGFLAGYGLTPDGAINGYRILNFKTLRITTKFNVGFNTHVPALRYILAALVNSPQQLLVGRTITKRFDSDTFTGKITGHSTQDNVTLYDISYTDGDSEQMDLVEVLKHISPIQDDMSLHRPSMHKRLRMAAQSDRARIGKDLLPSPTLRTSTPPTMSPKATVPSPAPTSKLLLRRSHRSKKPPQRLISTTLGSLSNSTTLPLLQQTHTLNKACASTIPNLRPLRINVTSSRPMDSCDAVMLPGGAIMYRYSTKSPPLPKVPPRAIPSPTDYDDAIHGPFKLFWRPAWQKEIDSLLRYKVWKVAKLPKGALVLPCKAVFKVKPNGQEPPGIDKFKARYCGKGYLQKKGIHFINVFAPVAAAVTTRIIIAIATELDWPLHGMDVSNAYLNADLEATIVLFVQPPPTIKVPRGYGLRLCKGLYGTMQGGNRWAVHKHLKLTSIDMVRSAAEPSLYSRYDSYGIVFLAVIVDDFAITGWPLSAVARLKAQLATIWDMTDLGQLTYFANIEIKRDRAAGTTTMKQSHYIDNMLAKYGLTDTYDKHTPCTTSIYDQRLLDPASPHPPMFDNNYANMIGTLGYLRRTRPDLCVAIGVTAQFVKPGRHGPQHYRAVRNIMRHCKKTRRHGLLYTSSRKRTTDPWDIKGHVDSDWAAWKGTRRSRSGWLIFLNNMLISFGSKLQTSVALSSAEAEYMALALIIKELLWILHIIEYLPGQFVRRPIPIYIDNAPSINLANNYAASKFTRHIGICHHFLRDYCEGGNRLFQLIWTNSSSNISDGMTKPLPRQSFENFRDKVVSDHEC